MVNDIDMQAGALTDIAAQGTVHQHKDNIGSTVPAYPNEKEVRNSIALSDGVHHEIDGYIVPTLDELEGPNKLRRISAKIPFSVYTVAFVELCERFSYYGTQVVFSNFVNYPLPNGSQAGSHPTTGAGGADGQSGALGMGTQAAQGINTFNSFWIYTTPLLGAYLADAHWGRYKTICIGIGIAVVAHILFIIATIPPVIVHSQASLGVFMLGIVILGLGTGGFKPNISPLVVEQIPVKMICIETLSSGERVIVDPQITQSRIYHYFYLFINIGALVGQIGMVYAEKYVGFWLSFTLPTLIFLLCPAIMFWGRKRYDRSPPTGSVFGKFFRIWGLAQKNCWSINPVTTYKRLSSVMFWENVKPSNIEPAHRPTWMTFDDAFVDEVRRALKACSVFCWYPLYWIAYNQLNNNLIAQASTMQLNGLPNDILNNLDPFALIIFIPLCDIFLYPGLRKLGIRFTPIRKITAGFMTGMAAMIWSTVVQAYIYRESPCGTSANTCTDDMDNVLGAPINVWAQTGAYVLIALSEIFASITSLEYAYSKAPKSMRSMVQAIALFTSAIAAAIGEALNPLSADPLLTWNYGVSAVLAGVGGILFYLNFRHLDREEDQLNLLPEGHVNGVQKDLEIEEERRAYEDAEASKSARPVAGEIGI